MPILADRVRESSQTTGTGDFTLDGAASGGFFSFQSSFSVGDSVLYVIQNPSANEAEVGLGTLTATNVLQRTVVDRSTNSDALVNFSAGTKAVFVADTTRFLYPYTATGDVLYRNAAGLPVALPIGTAGQTLTVAAGLPSWGTGGGTTLPVVDTQTIVKGSVDPTKLLRFEVDSFTAGATRVLTPPNQDATIAGLEVVQTFTVAQTIDAHVAMGVGASVNGTILYAPQTVSSILTVLEQPTDLTSTNYYLGVNIEVELDPAVNATANTYALSARIATESANAQNAPLLIGGFLQSLHRGSGTIVEADGLDSWVMNLGSGKIETAYGNYTYVSNDGAGTDFDTVYGLYLDCYAAAAATFYSIFSVGGTAFFEADAATREILQLQRHASQSVNMLENLSAASAFLSGVNADGKFILTVSAGAPVDTPVDGAVHVDTTNSRFYVRSGAAWNYITFSTVGALPVVDTTAIVKGSADPTKLMRFEIDGFTAGATRVLTPPDADINLPGTNIVNTWTLLQTFSTSPTAPLGSGTNSERFGAGAGVGTATGDNNIAIGSVALGSLSSGIRNIGIGTEAGSFVSTGSRNLAFGFQCLQQNVGINNVFVGDLAGKNVSSGNENTGIGTSAGLIITGGSSNVFIGAGANATANSVSSAVALGYAALCSDNELAIGPYVNFQTWYGLSSTSATRQRSDLTVSWVDSTDATRKARVVLNVWDTAARCLFQGDTDGSGGNFAFFSAGSYGGGRNVIFIPNAAVAPSTDPVGGGILYAAAGALLWRGSSATVTTIAAAEPHCHRCGKDFVLQWRNDTRGWGKLGICLPCLVGSLTRLGINPEEYLLLA